MTGNLLTAVPQAARYLLDGQLVAIPTETVYGLAGNALDAAVVAEIFRVKNRPSFDPLIIHGHSPEQLFALAASVPAGARQLADAFWPGPLTLLLPRGPEVPDLVTAGSPFVALRVPRHPLTLALLRSLPFPVAAPSANPFGYVSPTTAQHVADQLGDQIAGILDGGPCEVGLESTIVGFPDGKPAIYRRGGISQEAIEALLGLVEQAPANPLPVAPGMLARHYSPATPLILGDIPALLATAPEPHKVAVLSFSRPYRSGYPQDIVLAPDGQLATAARHLFAALRTLDASGMVQIIGEWLPDEGLGRAINDRLRRAAAQDTIGL
ncbi:MAG: threonylcarbamoyl-AMP synthase [Bacteroidetes bacterium]|nr:threonylcarbamoyl-AMP synthase [Bacteroidota bacterium]